MLNLKIIYFLYNSHLLSYSHFDEDAYILFRYADMFNKGYGITFYPNAVPIEGATDFLWLVCIIATSKLGLDIGTSAVILKSIGVFGITYIFILLLSETIKNNFILSIESSPLDTYRLLETLVTLFVIITRTH